MNGSDRWTCWPKASGSGPRSASANTSPGLWRADNRLRGDMPPELSRISHLSDLTLGGSNQFASCIPQGLHENAFSHVLLSDLDQLGLPFCGAAGSAST